MTLAPIWGALDKQLPGQETAVRALSRIVANKALAHAYLFAGPAGSGKLTAALTFACAANCPDGGCGTCDICTSVELYEDDKQRHLDIRVARPDGVDYGVEQLRDLRHTLASRSVELPTRFLILDDAERMKPAAANTLLKTIEEPPPGTTVILVTSLYEAILETIRSRCQLIEFKPVAEPRLVGKLVREMKESGAGPMDVASAKVAYHAAGGRPDAARQLLSARVFSDARSLVGAIVDGLGHRSASQLVADAEALEGLLSDLGQAVTPHLREEPYTEEAIKDMAISRAHSGRLTAHRKEHLKHVQLVRRQEGAGVVLQLFALAFRDVLCAANGAEELVADPESIRERGSLVRHGGSVGATRALESVACSRGRIARNVIPKHAFEAMLFEMAEVGRWRRQSA